MWFPLAPVDTCGVHGTFIGIVPREPTSYAVRKFPTGLASKKVNIDIGTKILKEKRFGRKHHFPGTYSNFWLALKKLQIKAHLMRIVPRLWELAFDDFFEKLHVALDLQVGGADKKTNEKHNKSQKNTNDKQTTNKQQTNNN